jgi:hypothetical protein
VHYCIHYTLHTQQQQQRIHIHRHSNTAYSAHAELRMLYKREHTERRWCTEVLHISITTHYMYKLYMHMLLPVIALSAV